jgi:F0F1-type ATP synthase membrane subunit c/vacuolar-type H+-ATPase subunit K
MLDPQHSEFWRVISTISGTFAGFTLAGYSIYISRTEKAAADPVCRQYRFKECTSSNAVFFMLFALTMFVVPLFLGLLLLSPSALSPSSDGRSIDRRFQEAHP